MENYNEEVRGMGVEVSTQASKKEVNVLAIVLGVLVVIFMVAAGFFGWQYFKSDGSDGEAPVGKQEKSQTETATMAEEYQEVYNLMEGLVEGVGKSNSNYIDTGSKGVIFKPEGLNTNVPVRIDLEAEILSADEEGDILKIEGKLEDAGFTSTGIMPFLGSAGPKIDGYLNSNKNIVCAVHGDTKYISENVYNDYVYLICAKADWHLLSVDEKSLIKELETAYYDKTGEYPSVLWGFGNKIKDSEYEPYQTLWVSVGGAAGLFYRMSPEAEWQYFTATQGMLECNEYNTDDLKKAYLGETCYNGQELSKVEL